jgi:hypothetical protein
VRTSSQPAAPSTPQPLLPAARPAPASYPRALEDRRYAAMVEAELDTLDDLLSDDVIYTHSDAPGRHEDVLVTVVGSGPGRRGQVVGNDLAGIVERVGVGLVCARRESSNRCRRV